MEVEYQPDLVIVVPKDHELRQLERVFGIEFEEADGTFDSGALWYRMTIQDVPFSSKEPISAAVVFLNDQGTGTATKVVTEAIYTFKHSPLFILYGTAAGRTNYTNFGDVVVSTEGVLDVTQKTIGQRAFHRPIPRIISKKIKADVNRYLCSDDFKPLWESTLKELNKQLEEKALLQGNLWSETPRVLDKMVAGGDNLYETEEGSPGEEMLDQVWNLNDHLRCIDMESAGFCAGLQSETRRFHWIVVRGISDSGTYGSRTNPNKKFGALAAAAWLKLFLNYGLREAHPKGLKTRQIAQKELSKSSIYSKVNVKTITENAENKFNINLGALEIGTSLTLDDLSAICISCGAPAEDAKNQLQKLRENYFTEKYLAYDYSKDLRGQIPQWDEEILSIFDDLAINLSLCRVLDVGCGNGLELPTLFSGAKDLIVADISKEMLQKCKNVLDRVKTIHAPAENLAGIASGSIDLYVSFRTFQSSLFNINAAIREAHRVLAQDGVFIISIANGFVDFSTNVKSIVRGLLIPGSTYVDRNLPYRISEQVIGKLHDFSFLDVGTHSRNTDVYVYGRKQ